MKTMLDRNRNYIALLGLLLLLWLGMTIVIPGYGSVKQLSYIVQQAAFLGMAAIGQTLVMLLGGMDLSVGYMLSFSGIMVCLLGKSYHMPLAEALLITLLIMSIFGLLNGIGVALLKLPPIVMTLAMSTVLQGLSIIVTKGSPYSFPYSEFSRWVIARPALQMSNLVFIWLFLILVMMLLLKKTSFGAKLYMAGSNPDAAAKAGVNIRRITIWTFVISALFCGMTGVFLVGYTRQSAFNIGSQYLFTGIATVIIGGISNGKGNYLGTVLGALIMTIIQSCLVMLKLGDGTQSAIQGVAILVIVVVYSLGQRKGEE